MLQLVLFGSAAAGLFWLVYLVYLELRNADHVWHHDADLSYFAEDKPLVEACRAELARREITLNLDRGVMFLRGMKIGDLEGDWYPCPNHPERLLRRRYPTCRIHLRLCFPHKQKCWVSSAFWREAWRILRSREGPVLQATSPSPPS